MTERSTAAELRLGAVAQAVRRHRLIVVLRRIEPQAELLALADALADAGARVLEVTFDADSAAADLGALRNLLDKRRDGPFLLGAGTLLTKDQLAAARGAGADFGVSPVLDLGLTRAAVGTGFPFVPAGLTPTEINGAWLAGATFVKLFPASAVGPQLIRELRRPLPLIEIIPNGGIDATNAPEFLAAGATAVGIGSALTHARPAERRALVMAIGRP